MPNVLTKTAAQMTADGFALLYGAGERVQMWGGASNGEFVARVFDSTGNRAMTVKNTDAITLATFAMAVVTLDLVSISTATAPQKSAAQAAIVNALDRL